MKKLATITLLALAPLAHAAETSSLGACSPAEAWTFGPGIPAAARTQFGGLIRKKTAAPRSFADALAVKQDESVSEEARAFAEYWMGRALFQAGLVHPAYATFSALAARRPDARYSAVQAAAVGCMNRVYRDYPSLQLPNEVSARLPEYFALPMKEAQRNALREYAGAYLRAQLAAKASPGELQSTLALLQGASHEEWLSQGLVAALREDHDQAIKSLESFLEKGRVPEHLARHQNQARLLLARSYYAKAQFEKASAQYLRIERNSNELASMLTELSWSSIQSGKYADAIGTAINLQSGGMRRTFSPEAPMVMAMALNELCQYPDAIRAIRTFKRDYEGTYRWLKSWSAKDAASRPSLYPLAVRYLKREDEDESDKARVPARLASEWIRSPVFISHQDEISLWFREREKADAFAAAATDEKSVIAEEVRELNDEVKEAIAEERAGQKHYRPGVESFSPELQAEIAKLKRLTARFRKLEAAEPIWKAALAELDSQASAERGRLVERINSDLAARNSRMLAQLEDVAENNQMIEVEIYNGASHDMIFQNAHPEYRDVAKKLKEDVLKAGPGSVWDWGRYTAGSRRIEVWEDELGNFKASLFDNCSSKEKYLALARKDAQ